ncbi:hypothetical protein ASQ50_06245 [Marinobacter sp. LQ44]|nr:hypothetical protein ASQ50_06245 [Marinobacter sp. LQ44]
MVNIDEVGDHFEIEVYVSPDSHEIPASVGYAITRHKGAGHRVTASVNAIDPRSGRQTSWGLIKHLYPESVYHNDNLDVDVKFSGDNVIIESVDGGAKFSGKATNFRAPDCSRVSERVLNWDGFKQYLSGFSGSQFLFRGQSKPWPLRTSFHRRNRYLINKFINDDVVTLHRRVSGLTSHFFDISVPEQNGAFLNLLQHHGYPTPLLDWSYSPYVAAFFAFRDVKKNSKEKEHVRIFLFDKEAWVNDFNQLPQLICPNPHLSVMEFLSVNNPRQSPQQAITTVTNVADIEGHVLSREEENKRKYIYAVDIPYSERDTAMDDLRYMGITAGSMFPGIDGVCEALKEANFES